jgi:hypothetical protein
VPPRDTLLDSVDLPFRLEGVFADDGAFCVAGVVLSMAIAAVAVIRLVNGCWRQSACQRPAVGIS